MYPYITCTCGRSIGDLYTAFKVLRQQKIKEVAVRDHNDIIPEMMLVGGDLQIDLEKELDDLGLTMSCCRLRILSQVEFTELY